MCLNCRVLRHMHVKGHSRNFCRHKPIFVFSQTATNPANNHTLTTGHTTLLCNAYNLTMNKQKWYFMTFCYRMTGTVTGCCHNLNCCHVMSQKWASSIKVCFNCLNRLVAKHKMTSNNWAGYGNTYPSQNFWTTVCTVNTANLLHSNVAYILNFNASYGKNISIYYSNKC